MIVLLIRNPEGMAVPLGAAGQVVGLEPDGDVAVEFFHFPCPAGPGPEWICHPSWLMPIDPEAEKGMIESQAAGNPRTCTA